MRQLQKKWRGTLAGAVIVVLLSPFFISISHAAMGNHDLDGALLAAAVPVEISSADSNSSSHATAHKSAQPTCESCSFPSISLMQNYTEVRSDLPVPQVLTPLASHSLPYRPPRG